MSSLGISFVMLSLAIVTTATQDASAQSQPPARTDPYPGVGKTERNFVKDTLTASRKELATADLAMDQAADPMVKTFAKMIVDDHTKSNAALEDIARKNNIETAPEADLKLSLASEQGPAFDRAFIKEMVSDHTKAVERFKEAEKQITDPELHDFIEATLPLLQSHLDQAKSLSKELAEKPSEK
jgi:putative membrane protein